VIDIETERLILHLVPLAGLAATAANDVEASRRIIASGLPDAWFEESWVAELRLNQWKDDPSYGPWSIRAIALKDGGQIVGNMNCHHQPMTFIHDGKSSLAVELGYTIFEPWRRMGLALEAIRGFTAWAATQGVGHIVLSISPGNEASLALARKLGAFQIGSQIDELDGPEDIYLAAI
jgi:[ribosomal protein S5]-alanine N-acetyltransferase